VCDHASLHEPNPNAAMRVLDAIHDDDFAAVEMQPGGKLKDEQTINGTTTSPRPQQLGGIRLTIWPWRES
jgi:hypothetical protein